MREIFSFLLPGYINVTVTLLKEELILCKAVIVLQVISPAIALGSLCLLESKI